MPDRQEPLRENRGLRRFLRSRHKMAEPFTGNCPVRQHTGDGVYVGRCWHSTYGGVCPSHGDVGRWLGDGADLADADDRKLSR